MLTSIEAHLPIYSGLSQASKKGTYKMHLLSSRTVILTPCFSALHSMAPLSDGLFFLIPTYPTQLRHGSVSPIRKRPPADFPILNRSVGEIDVNSKVLLGNFRI